MILKKIKKLLKKYKPSIVGHTAWYLPIGSEVKSFRECVIFEAKRYFKVFSKLNIRYVTIHANWPSGRMFPTKEGIRFQLETLKKLVKEAKRYSIKIIYELTDRQEEDIKSVFEILDGIPNLYLHLDIGHANLFGGKPEEFIKRFHKKQNTHICVTTTAKRTSIFLLEKEKSIEKIS